MMEELKRRIEMINHGEVPNGYKKTESGIVPVEWKETMLRNLLDFKNGINEDKEKFGSGIKLISVMDILDNLPITYESIRGAIDIDKETLEKYSVTYGDILFQRSSENFDDAGKSNVYLDKDNTATYSGFVIRGKKVAEYEPFYLNQLLKTQHVRKQIIRLSAGSQHINIGQESLAQISINMAEASEQEKISEILMKWDKIVTLQEKLIEKLEIQKKALIQRIIHPQADWVSVPLKKILYERKTYSEKGLEYSHVTLSKEGIFDKTEQYNRDFLVSDEEKQYKITHYNDLCYNPANLKFGVICLNKYGDAIFSPIYVTYEINPKYNPDFIAAILTSNDFIEKIRRFEEGTIYERQAVKPVDFIKDSILIPKTLDEQEKSAKVVSVINMNIELQKQKLGKLKEQQKALMELLLTGIVRVNKGGN